MEKSERRSSEATITTLRSSKGAVLVNENGSFVYVCLLKNESMIGSQKKIQEPQQIMLPMFGDDELAFYINPQDLPDLVDEVLDTYLTHSRVFLVFMSGQMIVEIIFDSLIWMNSFRIEKLLAVIYYQVALVDIHSIMILCSFINILFQCIYYTSGIYGTWFKSYNALNFFSNLSIFGMFLQIFLSYSNQFNILVFAFRVLSCIYAKFLSHLILSLILLPH